MQLKEMEKFIVNMSEEQFEELAKTCTAEQVKIMATQRFFHKLFNDPQFYKAVEQAIGEEAYWALRAN